MFGKLIIYSYSNNKYIYRLGGLGYHFIKFVRDIDRLLQTILLEVLI